MRSSGHRIDFDVVVSKSPMKGLCVKVEAMSKSAWTKKDHIDNIFKKEEHAEFDESDTHVLERLNTSTGNPVKEILLKLNIPDHKLILTDSNVTPTKHGRMIKPYSPPCFIDNCFNMGYLKMEVKVPDSS
ncbi:hypothetical protein Tco_1015457 [Tanacetum coccineum]|uniref:Uncharacterized protein n=1 Tax=Tanacetum coccineum TaxID=301880 RepID=A0ABQ5FKZ6_9ASTR